MITLWHLASADKAKTFIWVSLNSRRSVVIFGRIFFLRRQFLRGQFLLGFGHWVFFSGTFSPNFQMLVHQALFGHFKKTKAQNNSRIKNPSEFSKKNPQAFLRQNSRFCLLDLIKTHGSNYNITKFFFQLLPLITRWQVLVLSSL